jgi:hypothetical protein
MFWKRHLAGESNTAFSKMPLMVRSPTPNPTKQRITEKQSENLKKKSNINISKNIHNNDD